ncbi:hypothetical protein GC207_01400 [bacterium]|nr:hypothetical protein [bacterium]
MQTTRVSTAAFPGAAGADDSTPASTAQTGQNSTADFEQIMQQSAGGQPQRSPNQASASRASTQSNPANAESDVAGDGNAGRSASETRARNLPNATGGGNNADEQSANANLPGNGATGSVLASELIGTGAEIPAAVDQATDADPSAEANDKGQPTDTVQKAVAAGLAVLGAVINVEPQPAAPVRGGGDVPSQETNPGKIAPDANPVPPTRVAADGTNLARASQVPIQAARMVDPSLVRQIIPPVQIPVEHIDPAQAGGQPLTQTAETNSTQPAAPDAKSSATDAPTHPPDRKTIQAPTHETRPVRHETAPKSQQIDQSTAGANAQQADRQGRRGAEGDVLRGIDFARFQNLAEDAAASVSPALLRRAQPQPFTGIGAAKMDSRMDKGLEQNQFAGSTEQKMPAGNREVTGRDLEAGIARVGEDAARESAEGAGDRTAKLFGAAGETMPATALGTTRTITVNSADGLNAIAPARTAEQLLQNITREVVQFKHFNAESMAVVLKPDANTEIFLHMVSRNGQIEIQARFDRGDFNSLNGQWAQLQHTLSQQGVRLSGLQDGFNQAPGQQTAGGSGWGHGQMNQQQQHREQPGGNGEPTPAAFDDLLLAGPARETVKRMGLSRRPSSTRSALEAWA